MSSASSPLTGLVCLQAGIAGQQRRNNVIEHFIVRLRWRDQRVVYLAGDADDTQAINPLNARKASGFFESCHRRQRCLRAVL